MKKFFLIGLTVLAVLLLASCVTAAPASNGGEVVFSDNWWDNPPADTSEFHYEVGYAKGSTLQTSRDWAKANRNARSY